jgi:hypothetical protein
MQKLMINDTIDTVNKLQTALQRSMLVDFRDTLHS